MSLDDAARVREQYVTEENLEIRRQVWQPTTDGRDPATEALAAVAQFVSDRSEPATVLEVGCGTGEFAARLDALARVDVLAVDQSDRFVELTRQRGVRAQQADVTELPFDDHSASVVTAMWMLYHVPDLHRGLAEIRRVLRPGGLLVATTNGDGHVRELREAAGGPAAVTRFSSQNGAAALRHQFDTVERQDFHTRAVFPDHASALAYLESSPEDIAWDLPWFEGPREYAGEVTVFLAS